MLSHPWYFDLAHNFQFLCIGILRIGQRKHDDVGRLAVGPAGGLEVPYCDVDWLGIKHRTKNLPGSLLESSQNTSLISDENFLTGEISGFDANLDRPVTPLLCIICIFHESGKPCPRSKRSNEPHSMERAWSRPVTADKEIGERWDDNVTGAFHKWHRLERACVRGCQYEYQMLVTRKISYTHSIQDWLIQWHKDWGLG